MSIYFDFSIFNGEYFDFSIIAFAAVVGILTAVCAVLLGTHLVLKRYSMIGDGLSHVSFGALAIAVALGFTPLYFSIPVVILAAFLLLRVAEHPRWNADAAIAVMSASSLAVGIMVISLTTGMTTDVDNYMFGSVLAMTKTDVVLAVVLCIADMPPIAVVVCETDAEFLTGSFVIMLMVPAIADDPKRADPPPRMTSTRSTMFAGSCSIPYTPANALNIGRESIRICVY